MRPRQIGHQDPDRLSCRLSFGRAISYVSCRLAIQMARTITASCFNASGTVQQAAHGSVMIVEGRECQVDKLARICSGFGTSQRKLAWIFLLLPRMTGSEKNMIPTLAGQREARILDVSRDSRLPDNWRWLR